jgi:excisionase family DNA binding protein
MPAIETPPNRRTRRAEAAANRGKETIGSTDKFAFTIGETAHLTSLSRSYLYGEIKDGKLRLTKKGSRSLVLRDDLLAYLRGEGP